MFDPNENLYAAIDVHTNKVVKGRLNHNNNKYQITWLNPETNTYIVSDINFHTLGAYTGKNLDGVTGNIQVFINDVILTYEYSAENEEDEPNSIKATVIWDENNFCLALRTEEGETYSFSEWNWEDSSIIDYNPVYSQKPVNLDDIIIPHDKLEMKIPGGLFRASAYKHENGHVGMAIEYIDDNKTTEFNSEIRLETNIKTGKMDALIFDSDVEDFVEYYNY